MFDCKNKLLEVNKTKELFEKESDKNFFKILEYNRNYEKFLKIIKDTSELSVNFWSEMEKNVFQPKIFEKRGFEICKSTTKLEKYSKLILTNNPYDIRTLKIYGTFLNHVLKLSKALYGLKQAPRAWYERLSNFLLEKEFSKGKVGTTLFIKKSNHDLLIVQIYIDDIIFSATNYYLCEEFSKLMQREFEMSVMGELKFFLGL